MSAKKELVVEVQNKLDDITECSICIETYKEPKILPCIHTFCMTCLQETGLKTVKRPGDKMPCPVCRTEFIVPEIGFVGLQRNFFMEKLIEMKIILNPSATRVVCDACQEENDLGGEGEIPSADMYCVDCNQRLCRECCKNHKKCKATKDHRLLPLDGAQRNIPSIIKPYVCDQHENQPLQIYCSSCQEAVCALCLCKSHKSHDTSAVIDVIDDFRKIIQDNSDGMTICILDLKHKIYEEDNDKETFAQKVANVESEIKRMKETLLECTERDCNALLQQLNSIKHDRIKEHENYICDIETLLAGLESYQAYCTQVTTIGSDVDICRAVQNLKRRATELRQRYESISFQTFPNMWLRKTEYSHERYEIGNTIGKIEEIGDNQTSHPENKGSVIDVIYSFLDSLDGILNKMPDEVNKDACHIKDDEDIFDHSGACTAKIDVESEHNGEEVQTSESTEKEKSVEAFESIALDETKARTSSVDTLCERLTEIKIKIQSLVERKEQLIHEMDLRREHVSTVNRENHQTESEEMRLIKMKSNDEIVELRKQVPLFTSIAHDGNKTTTEETNITIVKDELTEKVRELEQELESMKQKEMSRERIEKKLRNYQPTPREIDGINSKMTTSGRVTVTGVTIMRDELFIAIRSKSYIDVYDSTTYDLKRLLYISGLEDPWDMCSCSRRKFLYIANGKFCDEQMRFKVNFEIYIKERLGSNTGQILRVDKVGCLKHSWNIGGDFGTLSITDKGNVILTVPVRSKIIEYDSDGECLREINISTDLNLAQISLLSSSQTRTGYTYAICPRQCEKLSNGNFLANYFVFEKYSDNSPLNYRSVKDYYNKKGDGLCIINDHGEVVSAFPGSGRSGFGQLCTPWNFVVDKEMVVLVLDKKIRISLLCPNLVYKRELVSKEHGLSNPYKMYLDEANGRLLVANFETQDDHVSVFEIIQEYDKQN